mgnify:CR=1 FL=1
MTAYQIVDHSYDVVVVGAGATGVETVVHGKSEEIRLVLSALVCGGHVLFEDLPGRVAAARDRMDIEYDMMRSARDDRFLYIRNFAPEQPYAGHIIYRNQSAIMQEWFRMQAESQLTGPSALWMRTSRPAAASSSRR